MIPANSTKTLGQPQRHVFGYKGGRAYGDLKEALDVYIQAL